MRIDRLVDIAFPRHLEKLEYQMRYVFVVLLDRFSKSQSITKNVDLDTGENFGLKHEGRFRCKGSSETYVFENISREEL